MSSRSASEGPGAGSASTMPNDDAILIPLCGLRWAIVIPNAARESKRMPATQDCRYHVYILTNSSRTLYVGITNNLERRMYEHKLVSGFTNKYNVTWLAYYEETSNVESAIAREEQIKGWRRSKKVALIDSSNPRWKDLSLERHIDFGQGL